MNAPIAIVIHGGSGRLYKEEMPPEKEEAYKSALTAAVQEGYAILKEGGTAVAAVEASIRMLEDSPLFNAGKGAVFSSDGLNELDAAIMDGKTMKAGSVAGTRTIRNPITAARAVMEQSEHVMLTGAGADGFAAASGLQIVDPSYFKIEERWEQIQQLKQQEQASGKQSKYGTVGAVALDRSGSLAAGTSTGGMLNKKWGRIGDTPVIGAGTYANQISAVSCTGYGEFFIRYTVARDIAALMEYKNLSVEEASREVLFNKVTRAGGAGGVITLDVKGNMAALHSTEGMFWASMIKDNPCQVNVCNMIIE
ncbi:isoaspartyl peptidase/L-asparaginase family protein [Nafulsella turpanensis]|uniref:isoaspartyl peptidase/L-asparaginase family protein n=1 Tax=Nafulsella turpanensis TaxID=1265690 RepID=UPI0003491565|nr:isoaspartyl peptidase/L-asparaginase [Nafulsella turpanensis]